MEWIDNQSDEDLEKLLKTYNDQMRELDEMVANARENIAYVKAEQSRRQLAAYWAANPELTPVAVGDKLLVTQEFMEEKDGVYRTNPSEWNLGVPCVAAYINISEGGVEFEFGSTGGLSIDTMMAMRRAYLDLASVAADGNGVAHE